MLKQWGYSDVVLDFRGHARRTSLGTTANLQGTLLDVILNVSLFTVNFDLFTNNPAHSLYREITCSDRFMQRPVYLSFGKINPFRTGKTRQVKHQCTKKAFKKKKI